MAVRVSDRSRLAAGEEGQKQGTKNRVKPLPFTAELVVLGEGGFQKTKRRRPDTTRFSIR